MTAAGPSSPSNPSDPAAPAPDHGPSHPWETCVWPLAAFLALGALEPAPSGGGLAGSLGIPMSAYPAIYALRLAVTLGLLAWHWPAIRGWIGRASLWPALLGLLLVIPWVALATLQREAGWAGWAGGSGERAAFNPFEAYAGNPIATWGYLLLCGLGLVVVVPIVEELFLRGFLMRYCINGIRPANYISRVDKRCDIVGGCVTRSLSNTARLLPSRKPLPNRALYCTRAVRWRTHAVGVNSPAGFTPLRLGRVSW